MKVPLLLVSLLGSGMLWPDLPLADTTLQAIPREDSAGGADADASQSLAPGGTVRLKTTLPQASFKGIIKSLDDTQITVVLRDGNDLGVPWTSIKRLDVQAGVRHRYGTAALIGGGVGVFLGLLVPNHEECFAPGCPDEEAFKRSQAVIIGGIVGALGGLWAEGATAPSAPRWERVDPVTGPPYRPAAGTSVGFGVTPGRDGLGVRLVLGFQRRRMAAIRPGDNGP